jgi:hypothetical protein
MKFKPFLFLFSYFIFNIGFSQEETNFRVGNYTEPCSDSKRTILCGHTGQKIYLAPGYSLREFTFIEYIEGPCNGIIEAVENQFLKDTFSIWVNDAQLKLQDKEPFVKGRKLKAVCTFLQDYDTLIAGGRGSQSGWYALEIVDANKKFTAPEIISAPAFEKFVKSFQSAGSNCDNTIFGVFSDSASQDTLCVFPSKIRNEIKGTYISKQSNLKSDIALKVLYNNYKGILQIQLPYPSESSFIYYNQNCWTLPGEIGTIYFADGSTFEGEIIPARPPKFFKRISK